MIPQPTAVPVVNDAFRRRLLKALGIDPEIAGDMKIDAPADGVYALNVWLFITPEAWEAAQRNDASDVHYPTRRGMTEHE